MRQIESLEWPLQVIEMNGLLSQHNMITKSVGFKSFANGLL